VGLSSGGRDGWVEGAQEDAELAVARGPAAVTVEDIAAAANVSARTVFNYFPTKEAAILGADPGRRAGLFRSLEARPAEEPPLVAMREAFRQLFTPEVALLWRTRARLARDHPQLQSAYLAGFSSFEDELTQAIGRRTRLDPVGDPYPRLVVSVALAALRRAVNHAIDRQRTEDMEQIVDEVFAAVGAGLPGPNRGPATGRAGDRPVSTARLAGSKG
jgi:AcrR family transcriptional regulator